MLSVGCSTGNFAPLPPYAAYVDIEGREHAGTNHKEVFHSPPPPPAPFQTGKYNPTGLGEQVLKRGPGGAVVYIGCNTGAQPCAVTLAEGFRRGHATIGAAPGRRLLGQRHPLLLRQRKTGQAGPQQRLVSAVDFLSGDEVHVLRRPHAAFRSLGPKACRRTDAKPAVTLNRSRSNRLRKICSISRGPAVGYPPCRSACGFARATSLPFIVVSIPFRWVLNEETCACEPLVARVPLARPHGVHADRAVGGDLDHRRPRGAHFAGRPKRPRGGPTHAVPQQHPQPRPGRGRIRQRHGETALSRRQSLHRTATARRRASRGSRRSSATSTSRPSLASSRKTGAS